ncbi:hypothetical protein F2S72_09000 [Pseudomonas syringae pv. actinidiae]|nr:hypothetical protein [Pseudomonas syringae pv. actinidiae]
MNIFEEPVSLTGYQLVKAFAACLIHLPEDQQIHKSSFDIWSAPLAETGASEGQMRQVGEWFALHHQTAPSLPYVIGATQKLMQLGALPPHRIAGKIERDAMAILHAAEQLGLAADDIAQAVMLAGTLAHLATYRRSYPHVGRAYLGIEVEGLARQSNYVADEILDEVATSKGDLKSLGPYLLHLDTDQHQGDE